MRMSSFHASVIHYSHHDTSMSPATRFELRRSLLLASYAKPTIASRRIHRLVCVSEPTAIGGNKHLEAESEVQSLA